jgi:hypothetical protein
VNARFRLQSASPYTITTGSDTNGDGVYNERPAGVMRNSGRGTQTKNLDLTLTWRLGIGHRRPADARDDDLLRFEIFANATNVLNLVNPENFSGVLTAPFFGLPTSPGTPRRIVVGTRVRF